jgi:leucyl aminopeptidase
VVLVGKGITFDTGGLSIKPREAMVSMKTDMAGAAAVLAVLLGCAELGVRRPVTGLLALAENAVGSSSYRPDDVVRHYGGRTVEVANTDAEGRMVLADALAYADAVLEPDVLIDLATLTGAASLGLGRRHAALYTADDELAAGLQAAAGSRGSGCGGCPWSRTTGPHWTRLWPTCATCRGRPPSSAAAPSPRRCSCGSSPGGGAGPTWTWPAQRGPTRTSTRCPRRHRVRRPAAAALARGRSVELSRLGRAEPVQSG